MSQFEAAAGMCEQVPDGHGLALVVAERDLLIA
jgi:hypothetical protein